jgi:Holliday junction resolvasome RuvABC endonuclease subunit
VLADVCAEQQIPMMQPTPQRIKKALTGRRDASKKDIQDALVSRYPDCEVLLGALAKTKREHAADALGAVVASLDSELVKMARRWE